MRPHRVDLFVVSTTSRPSSSRVSRTTLDVTLSCESTHRLGGPLADRAVRPRPPATSNPATKRPIHFKNIVIFNLKNWRGNLLQGQADTCGINLDRHALSVSELSL